MVDDARGVVPPSPAVLLRWACVVSALLALLPGLRLLSWIWDRSDYLAHGYLIPAVSLWLVWVRRDELLRILQEGKAPASGPLWVGLAALFESVAVAGEVASAAGLGLPLLLAATAYALGGRPLLVAAGMPIGLLALMVPPPGFVLDRVLMDLKNIVVVVSVEILHALGYTVAAMGNRLLVPGHELFVAHACSGLTSIVTLSPLAVVVAYFMGRGVWRRAVIVASIVPLAMLGNIIRVTGTVALVSSHGIEYADGLLHESFGMVTFLAGTVALLVVARLVE
jgi:exosortase